MSILDARKLAIKVLKQTMDSTLLVPDKVEMCEVGWEDEAARHVAYRVLKEAELKELCDEANVNAEAAKKN